MAWMEKIMVSRHGNAMSKDIFKANSVGQKVTTKAIQNKRSTITIYLLKAKRQCNSDGRESV